MNELQPLLDLLGGKANFLTTLIAWIGALKLFFHLIGGRVQAWAAAVLVRVVDSPDPNDDHFVIAVLTNRIYIGIQFLMALFSLPLPTKADYDAQLAKKPGTNGASVSVSLILLFLTVSFFVTGCFSMKQGETVTATDGTQTNRTFHVSGLLSQNALKGLNANSETKTTKTGVKLESAESSASADAINALGEAFGSAAGEALKKTVKP